jgi:hypothetical protein
VTCSDENRIECKTKATVQVTHQKNDPPATPQGKSNPRHQCSPRNVNSRSENKPHHRPASQMLSPYWERKKAYRVLYR